MAIDLTNAGFNYVLSGSMSLPRVGPGVGWEEN